jgi:hypothetical protein
MGGITEDEGAGLTPVVAALISMRFGCLLGRAAAKTNAPTHTITVNSAGQRIFFSLFDMMFSLDNDFTSS